VTAQVWTPFGLMALVALAAATSSAATSLVRRRTL
jgi:hypothetical protein